MDGTPPPHRDFDAGGQKEKKENRDPREGWEDGRIPTPPPHRDFRGEVWC